jgi:hypothetical protein
MTYIGQLRKDREIALQKLDDAMDSCGPEQDNMFDNVKKSKTEFLFSYKDYKNNRISEQEFLQSTNSFAQILDLEKKMYDRFSKILKPLQIEFEKTCEKIRNWENRPHGNDWWDRND